MRKKIFLIFLCLLFVSFIFADSKLVASHFYFDEEEAVLNLAPNANFEIPDIWKSKNEPILLIERLYRIEKKDLRSQEINAKDLSLCLRAFSKMQGIEYYSTRRKKTCVLYPKAFCIDKDDKKTPIPDDTQEDANGLDLYFFQEDNSLGKCFYSAHFLQNEDEVCALLQNTQNIKVAGITAVKKGELCITVLAKDMKDSISLYMLFRARFPNISFLSNRLQSSFSSRVDSIYDWFVMQLKE